MKRCIFILSTSFFILIAQATHLLYAFSILLKRNVAGKEKDEKEICAIYDYHSILSTVNFYNL
jgi:hypothetical protein